VNTVTISPKFQMVIPQKDGVSCKGTQCLVLTAAKLSVELAMSMADSLILATARAFRAILWMQDVDFASIQNVRYFSKNP